MRAGPSPRGLVFLVALLTGLVAFLSVAPAADAANSQIVRLTTSTFLHHRGTVTLALSGAYGPGHVVATVRTESEVGSVNGGLFQVGHYFSNTYNSNCNRGPGWGIIVERKRAPGVRPSNQFFCNVYDGGGSGSATTFKITRAPAMGHEAWVNGTMRMGFNYPYLQFTQGQSLSVVEFSGADLPPSVIDGYFNAVGGTGVKWDVSNVTSSGGYPGSTNWSRVSGVPAKCYPSCSFQGGNWFSGAVPDAAGNVFGLHYRR